MLLTGKCKNCMYNSASYAQVIILFANLYSSTFLASAARVASTLAHANTSLEPFTHYCVQEAMKLVLDLEGRRRKGSAR